MTMNMETNQKGLTGTNTKVDSDYEDVRKQLFDLAEQGDEAIGSKRKSLLRLVGISFAAAFVLALLPFSAKLGPEEAAGQLALMQELAVLSVIGQD